MTNLYLNNNKLTGSIPESMCNLTALKYLNLQNNQLTGIIPAGIFALGLSQFIYDKDKLTTE
ncbi:MAG: leucine-rich repeat domain-containing protein [Bacteroidales bacterium]|nr:leucine-rich repeat domain-containing protein [Bacteroidales bacterium]